MTLEAKFLVRLQFLARVVRKECQHLATTDSRLFKVQFTVADAVKLDKDADLAERVEAFVSRFARLQDTVGDKMLPQILLALGEKTSSVLDNLDRAERLGFLKSADEWMAMRQLRNQMIHEYIEDPALLANALQVGHTFVPELIAVAEHLILEMERRGWGAGSMAPSAMA